jgi:hypothetical protein
MKKSKTEFFYPILSTIITIIFCTIIWDYIILSYSNPHEIVGSYADQNYSVYNDTLRYLLFILLPVGIFFSFFLIKAYRNEDYFRLHYSIFLLKKNEISQRISVKFLLFFLSIAVLLFLFNDWNVYPLDIFEEGMPLSGSQIFEYNQKPWKDVYLNTGLFYDMLNGKISWLLTGYKTIGSFRFYIKLLNLVSILLTIYFVFELSNQIIDEKLKTYFFIFCAISVLYILKDAVLWWRDFPVIIFLISILKFLTTKKFVYLFSISFISVFSFFWGLDRGFFVFLSLIPFLIFIFINSKKFFFKFILSIIFFWIVTILIMGIEIFLSFFQHTKEILSQHEMINGLIHPKPFSNEPGSSRATKTLLMIILNFIISIIIVINKKDFFSNNAKFLFIFFSILSFLTYKTALSRSDGAHIKAASYFSIILFVIIFIYFVLYHLYKTNFFKNNLKKINIFIVSLIILIFVNDNMSAKNVYNFPNPIYNFISKDDSKFIKKEYSHSLIELKKLLNQDDCVQAFSHDQAIYYLLKKRSCSKFYNIWVIGSKKNQLIYIDELKFNKPKFILTSGKLEYGDTKKIYPYITSYLDNEYSFYKNIHYWTILKKN